MGAWVETCPSQDFKGGVPSLLVREECRSQSDSWSNQFWGASPPNDSTFLENAPSPPLLGPHAVRISHLQLQELGCEELHHPPTHHQGLLLCLNGEEGLGALCLNPRSREPPKSVLALPARSWGSPGRGACQRSPSLWEMRTAEGGEMRKEKRPSLTPGLSERLGPHPLVHWLTPRPSPNTSCFSPTRSCERCQLGNGQNLIEPH